MLEKMNLFNKYNLYMKKEYLNCIKSVEEIRDGFEVTFDNEEVMKYQFGSNTSEYLKKEICLRRLRHSIFKKNNTNLFKESQTREFFDRCQY